MKTLYIAYFGALKHLSHSQILPYLRELATAGVDVTLKIGGDSTAAYEIETTDHCDPATNSGYTGWDIAMWDWIGYVDPVKRKDVSTLEKFQAETGITVDYVTDVNDNEVDFRADLLPD